MRRLLLLLPVLLTLPGCVYSSAVPLGDPDPAAFDEALLGVWVAAEESESADEADSLAISRSGPGEYRVEWEDELDNGTRRVARAVTIFVTHIGDVRFLNITEEDGGYSFARYELAGDSLRVRFIADRSGAEDNGLSGTYASSEELREAVRARLHDPLLYEEEPLIMLRKRAR
jgi:hypothetical protein